MNSHTSVDPRRIAETLLASHLEDTCGEISNGQIRAHIDALVYEGLIPAGDAETFYDAVDEAITDAAENHNLNVTITG